MPRVRPLIKPDPDITAIREEIGAIAGALGISHKELAVRAGIAPQTFSRRMKNPGDFRVYELIAIRKVKRRWEGR